MSKVVAGLKVSSTIALMLESISQLLEVLTWTLEFHNVKIAENGIILHSHAEFKGLNVSNTMVLTNQRTTVNSASVAKPMWR